MDPKHPSPGERTPQIDFMRRLWRLDSKLAVRWNGRSERWCIMRQRENPRERPNSLTNSDMQFREWWRYTLIMTVAEDDGSYRDLDHRTIDMLRRADGWTRGSKAIIDEIESSEDALRAEDDRKIDDTAHAIASDMWTAASGRVMVGGAR